jgi:hypothetical protein
VKARNMRKRVSMIRANNLFLDNEGLNTLTRFHTNEIKIKAMMYCLLQFNAQSHPIFSSLKRYTRKVT